MLLLPFLLGDGEKMAGKSAEDYTSDIFMTEPGVPSRQNI